MHYSDYEALQHFAAKILERVGYPREKAAITAWALVEADARGVPSHGLQRLGDYESYVRDGLFQPEAPLTKIHETPTSLVLDGHNGIGMHIAEHAMKACIARAKEGGSGFCSVRNSNHYGMAGLWAEMAVSEGCLGIAMTNTEKFAIVTHGKERLLGTNPMAVALPAAEGKHFLLDMATTTVPHGKIEVYARRGLTMPYGWAVDDQGEDTGDAPGMSSLFKSSLPLGGQLMLGGRGELLGGHKGYGLGLLVELFCAALSGGTWSRHTFTPERGGAIAHFFAALDLRLFGNPEQIAANVENILEEIRHTPTVEGQERIYIHGEKEREHREKALASGVPLDEVTWRELEVYGERFSLEFPKELFPA